MGQICTSTSRIYVQDSIYETFVEQFKKYTVENSVVGSQFDPKTNHGPQVSQVQRDRILRYIEAAKSEGAKLVLGGETSQSDAKGFFVQPTIFKDTNRDMKVVREEVFGPFVVIESFSSQEDAIKKANDTEYGLGAAVFTENITKAHKVAAAIEAGMVWVSVSLGRWEGASTNLYPPLDQQFAGLALCDSVWWLQTEWCRTRIGRVRSFGIHAGQGRTWYVLFANFVFCSLADLHLVNLGTWL